MYRESDWEWDGEEFNEFFDEETDDLELALESEADLVTEGIQMWRAIPQDLKQMMWQYAVTMWQVYGPRLYSLIIKSYQLMRRRRLPMKSAMLITAQQMRLPLSKRRRKSHRPGMSPVQVKAYTQRRQQRLPKSRIKRLYTTRRY